MKQNLQSGTHLDADQLSMFVDGTASAREREQMLAHMGECAECRQVLFLIQTSPEPEAFTSIAQKGWTWRRWAMPIGLAGAALACSLIMAVYLSRHRNPAEIAGQNARVQAPVAPQGAPPAPNNVAAPTETRTAKSESRQPATNPKSVKQEGLRAGAPIEAPRTTPLPATGTATEQPQAPLNVAGVSSQDNGKPTGSETKDAAAQPPAAVPRPDVSEAPPPANNAAESQSFAAKSLPPLRIEHDRGPENGMSQVTGRVTDASGAVVPGAQISLRDHTGTTRQAISDGVGTFSLTGVPPGHYELEVTARGFETSRQTMDLKPRDLAMLDSVLAVGASAETVTVESTASPLDTESASVASIQVAELPSHLPVTQTVALGKHVLSLDDAGTLFFSRNRGKSWKRVKPQWAGKVAQIEGTNPPQTASERKKANTSAENAPANFRLTTDSRAVWTSNDGTHWHAQ